MSQVVIIEPEQKNFELFKNHLNSLDSDLHIMWFKTPKAFYYALKESIRPTINVNKKKNKEDEEEAVDVTFDVKKIKLIISDLSISEKISLPLWKKLLGHISQQSAAIGEPIIPKLILTAHEEASDDHSMYIDKDVYTVLMKPLDSLLVKQFFQLVLSEKEAISTDQIFTLDKEGTVEIIKNIEIESINELGFATISSREIKEGKIARYFGEAFNADGMNSVFAYCYASVPHPEIEGKYRCLFTFFGISKTQHSAIRRKIKENSKKETFKLIEDIDSEEVNSILIVSGNESLSRTLSTMIADKYKEVKVTTIRSFNDLKSISPASKSGKESEQGFSFFGTQQPVTVHFKSNFQEIEKITFETESGEESISELMGQSISEINSNADFFPSLFGEADEARLEEIIKFKKLESPVVLLLNAGPEKSAYLRLESIEKAEKIHKMIIKEMDDTEVSEYFKSQNGELSKVGIVFFDEQFCSSESVGSVRSLLDSVCLPENKTKWIYISKSPMLDYNRIQGDKIMNDIIVEPLDLFYVSRKIKMLYPSCIFKNSEDAFCNSLCIKSEIKTALPAKLISVSEVHIVLSYYREIEIGEIRRFVLWVPGQKDVPEISAVCRHVEKLEDGSFRCEFLFSAVRDDVLKFIRQWIKQAYVMAKSKS